jgi:hypothetical protein
MPNRFTGNTVGGTMNENKLNDIQAEIRSLKVRAGNFSEREVVGIAEKLGLRRAKRGSEPTYVSDDFPDKRPVRIPSHRVLKRGTALAVLSDLKDYVFYWRERLSDDHAAED